MNNYIYTNKELESYVSESPVENNIRVGGYKFNSLVEHPYKEAFSRFGVPVGLVVKQDRNDMSTNTSLTREMMHGGSANIPDIISDELYDKLFGNISVSRANPKNKTRKVGKPTVSPTTPSL